jgi:hypothetical protein
MSDKKQTPAELTYQVTAIDPPDPLVAKLREQIAATLDEMSRYESTATDVAEMGALVIERLANAIRALGGR